jgi:cytochrome c peroxidase
MFKSRLAAWMTFSIMAFQVFLAWSGNAVALDVSEEDYKLKLLGKYVFFDKISSPRRMACVTCHDPDTGGTGSVSGVNLHQVAITGANPHTVGKLKPPTNAYASFIQPFAPCGRGALGANNHCGGNFWNGRSEGREPALFPAGATKHIGNEVFQGISDADVAGYIKYFGPTADQALNPMPNPVEQNIDRQSVCQHVASAKYAELYEQAWKVAIDCRDVQAAASAPDVATPEKEFDISFKRIMLAVGAWQHSKELNSFSSKRDIALRNDADKKFPLDGLTKQENDGHDLFYNTRPNPFNPSSQPPRADLPVTNCSFCHTDNFPGDDGAEPQQLYADDAYHNIGTPPNPEVPAAPDPGVRGHIGNIVNPGFFKVPTMRNVDKRKGKGFIKAYTHNGWFKSLESLVHFYNTSAIGLATANSFGVTRCPTDIKTEKDALAKNCWPAPEWPGASPVLVGNLGLTTEQEAAIVAYLKTLTDTTPIKAPPPYNSAKQ